MIFIDNIKSIKIKKILSLVISKEHNTKDF